MTNVELRPALETLLAELTTYSPMPHFAVASARKVLAMTPEIRTAGIGHIDDQALFRIEMALSGVNRHMEAVIAWDETRRDPHAVTPLNPIKSAFKAAAHEVRFVMRHNKLPAAPVAPEQAQGNDGQRSKKRRDGKAIERARAKAEAYIARHEGWPGYRVLADLGPKCSTATIKEAIEQSPDLKSRFIESGRRSKSVRARRMSVVDDDNAQAREETGGEATTPQQKHTSAEIWERLVAKAKPKEVASLNAMDAEHKARLIQTIAEDPEQMRELFKTTPFANVRKARQQQ